MTERQELIGQISDDSKDANGSRLRLDFASMSLRELQQSADYWREKAHGAAMKSYRR